MEVISQVNRRKACDLCFTKKIKCDMLKPTCSNCQLYRTDCRTTAVRRRVPISRDREREPQAPQAASPSDSPDKPEQTNRMLALEDRLARIESQLSQFIAVASAAVTAGSSNTPDTPPAQPYPDQSGAVVSAVSPNENGDDFGAFFQGLSPAPDWEFDHPVAQHQLPPLDEILPVIDSYFMNFNSIIPLFQQPAFMRMLHDYYHSASAAAVDARPAVWAAVNIAMALAYRMPGHTFDGPSADRLPSDRDERVSRYLQNAQSVLSQLVTRDEDLLGLQVLLGMVILFASTSDPRPSLVLIGTAVRLAHRLRLHSRETEGMFSPEVDLQRSRLFWITYLLDKDISLRHQTPSLQNDNDIDLDLPSAAPTDGAGDLYTTDGIIRFNIFRARVQLGHIQGLIYDALFSTRGAKLLPQQRDQHILRLEALLEDWRHTIPQALQLENAIDNLGRVGLAHMATLHHGYMMCLLMIHGIYSHSADWIRRISSYSIVTLGDCKLPGKGRCMVQQAPWPRSWKKCVCVSRGCLKLLANMVQTDSTLWMNGCAYISGLIILLANIFELPDAETVEIDKELTQHAIKVFNHMKEASDNEFMTRINVIVEDLNRRARGAVDKIASKKRKAEEAGVPWIPTEELQRLTQDRGSILRPENDIGGLSAFDSHPEPNGGGFEGLFAGTTGSPFQHQDWGFPSFTSPFGTSMDFVNAPSYTSDIAVTSAAADPRTGLMFLG